MQRGEMGHLFGAAAVLLVSAVGVAAAQNTKPLPYLDPSLPKQQRAADLVGRMTLEEKVGQTGNAALAIPRLGVPAYNYWNEALHGVARSGYATMFPQAIGMAATWDAPLLKEIGDVISTEARAKNTEALREGNRDIFYGLTFWSPNINIFRDPRWGRGQETYGEDPFLTARLGVNFIEGLQGTDPNYFKVIATPKHYAVHSGPESERHRFDVTPTKHDLWDTYLPQFRAAIVEAKADSIMCAYNAIYGDPACGSKLLLQQVLREDWKFQGFVTSDCGALDDFFKPDTHDTEPDATHADRVALLAGTDTNCGSTYGKLGEAVKAGLIKESNIDVSLRRLFLARMQLGLFDPPEMVPYTKIPFSVVNSPANAAVAKRAAEESMVLLKNDGLLPLAPGRYKTVAVLGPNAASLASLEGNYNGVAHDPPMPVDALREALTAAKVVYAPGSPLTEGFAMPVPRTMLHPAAGSHEEGLKAEYFGSADFTGTPVMTRVDPEINFDWSGVSPLKNAPGSGFSVRWSGVLRAPAAGTFEFTLRTGRCRECVRTQSYKLFVDGQQIGASAPAPATGERPAMTVDSTTGLPTERRVAGPANFKITFAEGQEHSFQIEFARTSARDGTGLTLEWTPPASVLLPGALAVAKRADLVIAIVGLSPNLEGEEMPVNLPGFLGGDRTEITLPAAQEQMLEQVAAAGKPMIVVLLNGSALAVNWAQEHANAILEAWYPGEAGGRAIADTLLGKNNPSGRLPVTFYSSLQELPPFTDYSMKNRTYRYFTDKALYGFGYGLSYTKFAYSHVRLSSMTLHAGDPLTVQADVRNIGKMAGDEVAELYLMPPHDANGGLSPNVQMQGFQRVHLAPGAVKHVVFTLTPRDLSVVDAQGARSVQAGSYQLSVGGSQPDDPRAAAQPQTATFTIVGTEELPH